MNNRQLYERIIGGISQSVKQALHESKGIGHRTIDRKLWLAVASQVSRNKGTEAEYVKPLGRMSKDELVQRYVAALLIAKKPCPENTVDIASLKTFRLIGQKAIELGATIQDMRDVYDANASAAKTAKPGAVKAEATASSKLGQMIQRMYDAQSENDMRKFVNTISDILREYDIALNGLGGREWNLYVGYESTWSPSVGSNGSRNEGGYFSYENRDKVLKPGETLFDAMERKVHWRQGIGSIYDRYDCDSRYELRIFSKERSKDEMSLTLTGDTKPGAGKDMCDKLADHFRTAYGKLDKMLSARKSFNPGMYGFGEKPNSYTAWVCKYVPEILKNNVDPAKAERSWYEGIPIKNAECEFWTGGLRTLTPGGILYWVGGDSTDDEGKIPYSEWGKPRAYKEYSSTAEVYANIYVDEKEEMSKKIFEYLKKIARDGKLK